MAAPEDSSTSTSHVLVARLQQYLISCSKAVEDGDTRQLKQVISEIVEFLSSISDAEVSDLDDEVKRSNSIVVLSHILAFLSNPSLDQAIVDALSFELPKVVTKFSGVCHDIVGSVIDLFNTKCIISDNTSPKSSEVQLPSTKNKLPVKLYKMKNVPGTAIEITKISESLVIEDNIEIKKKWSEFKDLVSNKIREQDNAVEDVHLPMWTAVAAKGTPEDHVNSFTEAPNFDFENYAKGLVNMTFFYY